jgi:hypothetical protein
MCHFKVHHDLCMDVVMIKFGGGLNIKKIRINVEAFAGTK